MPVTRRNRGIMLAAMVLGAIFVALDHSQYRRSVPAPVTGEPAPQVEAGGYGSASEDGDDAVPFGAGAETGGYGAAGDDGSPATRLETGGYGAAADGQAAETATESSEGLSKEMEEYYRRLQLNTEGDDTR